MLIHLHRPVLVAPQRTQVLVVEASLRPFLCHYVERGHGDDVIELPDDPVVLPCHTREPLALDVAPEERGGATNEGMLLSARHLTLA